MTVVDYQSGKLIGNSVGCAVFAVLGAWVAFFTDWPFQARIIGGFLAASLPFPSIALALRIRSGLAALRFDRHTLEIATFFRSTSLRWQDVRSISRETLTQSSLFGLVKQTIARYLVIVASTGDGQMETYRIQEDILDWPKDGCAALADQMIQLWTSPAATPRAAPAPASAAARSPGPDGMQTAAIAPRGFGRRGL